jgi:PPK2 family polyphosphate:nucleotide phosphotransferase
VGTDALVRLASGFAVTDAPRFRLGKVDPDDTRGFYATKSDGDALLQEAVTEIAALQQTLYAQNQWGVLLIFQAMDAAGKDSAIKHVFSGVNPQGVQVFSFKAPSAEELDHDFLWRTTVRLPERGRIGVFNRSYYEEVLVVRLHPDLLAAERLPARVVTKRIWDERFEDINAFEQHLARSGYVIRKFFLHVSRKEQARRFLKRLEEPEKRWKFSMGDIRERKRWTDSMGAYEDAIRRTSTAHAPWTVVPADRKWFARLVIAGAVVGALRSLKLQSPAVSAGQEHELDAVREALRREVEPASRTARKRRKPTS